MVNRHEKPPIGRICFTCSNHFMQIQVTFTYLFIYHTVVSRGIKRYIVKTTPNWQLRYKQAEFLGQNRDVLAKNLCWFQRSHNTTLNRSTVSLFLEVPRGKIPWVFSRVSWGLFNLVIWFYICSTSTHIIIPPKTPLDEVRWSIQVGNGLGIPRPKALSGKYRGRMVEGLWIWRAAMITGKNPMVRDKWFELFEMFWELLCCPDAQCMVYLPIHLLPELPSFVGKYTTHPAYQKNSLVTTGHLVIPPCCLFKMQNWLQLLRDLTGVHAWHVAKKAPVFAPIFESLTIDLLNSPSRRRKIQFAFLKIPGCLKSLLNPYIFCRCLCAT